MLGMAVLSASITFPLIVPVASAAEPERPAADRSVWAWMDEEGMMDAMPREVSTKKQNNELKNVRTLIETLRI
jgi:hypothetical protein